MSSDNKFCCYYCQTYFDKQLIIKYVGLNGDEPLCPNCKINSVIPSIPENELKILNCKKFLHSVEYNCKEKTWGKWFCHCEEKKCCVNCNYERLEIK